MLNKFQRHTLARLADEKSNECYEIASGNWSNLDDRKASDWHLVNSYYRQSRWWDNIAAELRREVK